MLRQAMRQAQSIIWALRNERLSPKQVQALQNQRLRVMVQHAWSHSPFYRAKFTVAGIKPKDIQSVQDLVKLPPTTKQELQAAQKKDLLAQGFTADNTIFEATSGSSGQVLHIYHSIQAYNAYFAFAFRHLWDIGYRPWHRVAYTAFEPLIKLPWEKFGLGTRQQIDLKTNDSQIYLQDLLRIRPQVITAYPSVLQLIIHTATPDELARIRPRVIHLHSELLTDGIRDSIQQAFGCECFDDYSTFEFHHVAYECRQHSYHLAADNVVVEFVRDGQAVQAGQEGEILLTGLTNRAMPLLRYAIGDVGVPSNKLCPCGRGFPTMQLIQGRVDDYIVLLSGRRFSPRMINPVFENLPGIREHVLVQQATDHFIIYLNVTPEHKSSTPALVRQALQNLFAEPIHIEIKLTTEFERGRTGKLRCIVSKVNQPVQATN